MRRLILLAAIVLAFALGFEAVADASLYRGIAGHGARVEFRVKDGEVTFARVRIRLHCVRGGKRYRHSYGEAFYPRTRPDGSFEEEFETEEPGYGKEYELAGRIDFGEITGRFEYKHYYQGARQVCRASFSFRAPLQTGAS